MGTNQPRTAATGNALAGIDFPIFLIGCQRSGTTLLRIMIDHHPEVSFKDESEYFTSFFGSDDSYPSIAAFREHLHLNRGFSAQNLRIDPDLDFPGLVKSFLLQQMQRSDTNLVGTTVHIGYHRLLKIWPQARFIYLYRDPRDVAVSVVRMGWAGNTFAACDWWLNAEREWRRLRSQLPNSSWIEVRYEDLIIDPRLELSRICAFIGVSFKEAMFDYVGNSTYDAPDQSLIFQWKKSMARREAQEIEFRVGARLLERGYQPIADSITEVSAFRQRCLRIHSRAARYLFRIRRFGFPLTLQETIARRLKLSRLERSDVLKINRIEELYLKL